MKTSLAYGKEKIGIEVSDNSDIYESDFPEPKIGPMEIVKQSLLSPINSSNLQQALKKRKNNKVVIVVSDITRPIPYASFLQCILDEIETAGIERSNITILIATGMHRISTENDRLEILGIDICNKYKIIDHDCENKRNLLKIEGKSKFGSDIILNRYLVEAGFKIVTGLVEPHFMAGFSGGRKSICPGLVSLKTIQTFHGFKILNNKNTINALLKDNPCHEESLSVAKAAKIDFSVNIVLNKERHVINSFAGELETSHAAACDFVIKHACPKVNKEYDIVITSSGGYPLDATFYQVAKGIISCMPVVKKNGIIISIGECCEGIGSEEYKDTMFKYSEDWRKFVHDIKATDIVIKDQWQLQMQTHALEKIGKSNLYFVSDTFSKSDLSKLNVNPVCAEKGKTADAVQKLLKSLIKKNTTVAVFPDGPYCAPLKAE
ncbi:MAG: nickel-dependent lactate racemase [bacterium]|nr:nickel-dependent lactate racemase [bacterium]